VCVYVCVSVQNVPVLTAWNLEDHVTHLPTHRQTDPPTYIPTYQPTQPPTYVAPTKHDTYEANCRSFCTVGGSFHNSSQMTRIDTQMTRIDTQMTRIDTQMTRIDTQMTRIDTQMTRIDTQMNPVHALIYNSPTPCNVSFRRNQVLRNSLYFLGVQRPKYVCVYVSFYEPHMSHPSYPGLHTLILLVRVHENFL